MEQMDAELLGAYVKRLREETQNQYNNNVFLTAQLEHARDLLTRAVAMLQGKDEEIQVLQACRVTSKAAKSKAKALDVHKEAVHANARKRNRKS